VHTDCGSRDNDRETTVLVYLNDVAGGGETEFPRLGLSVSPEKGTALLFQSLREVDVEVGDSKLESEGGARSAGKGKGKGEGKGEEAGGKGGKGGQEAPRRQCDRRTEHTAAPVTAGQKYVLQRWFHERPFTPASDEEDVHLCDTGGNCREYVFDQARTAAAGHAKEALRLEVGVSGHVPPVSSVR
jgi:hypothetical protein